MSRRTKLLLYAAFTGFAFLAGLLLTFPYDVLGRRIEAEVAKKMPGTTLVVNELGPALPIGLRLADLVITKAGKDDAPASRFTIDRIRVRPAFLALLTGKAGISFNLDLLAGTIHGQAVVGKDGPSLETVIEGLQLDEGKSIEGLTGLQLAGGMSGRVEIAASREGQVSTGNVAIIIAGAKIKSGKIAGFTLPPIDLGSPELSLTIDKGEAKIAKFETRSPDIELNTTGSISLRPDLMASLIRGSLKLRPTDPFLNKNQTIKTAMSLAGPFKKPDGTLELPLSGTLARPVSLPGFGR